MANQSTKRGDIPLASWDLFLSSISLLLILPSLSSPFFFSFTSFLSSAVETMICRHLDTAIVHVLAHWFPPIVEGHRLVSTPSDEPWWWRVSHEKQPPSQAILWRSLPHLWSRWSFLGSLFRTLFSSIHFS